jgi:hypothetical protein
MERMLPLRTSSLAWTVPLLALVLAATLPVRAQAQPSPVLLRVVDQNGQELTGSVVRLVGTEQSWQTPATAMLDFGPQLVTVEPAFQGSMFPGGWVLPGAPNGLQRDEFLFVDGSPELVILWQTAQVAINVVDQASAPVSGGAWGFEGGGAFFAPGTVTAPITDENVYGSLAGPSRDGWRFAVRTAFDGQAIDLTRAEAREVDGATTGLSFEWRQSTCNMGVVDDTGAPIRGATWTMFGHTFAAGDAITLPTTDESLYPTLAGALAAGIPTSLFTNTPSGTGNATFEVNADGSLAPAFVSINGGSFGLRCGVDPFPPITTGTLDGTVLADGKPMAGVSVALHDANGATRVTLSDAVGGFLFVDTPEGAAMVEITVPAGFHTLEPKSGQIATTIVAGATTTVQFEIESDVAPPPVVNEPETANYWRREVRAALRGRGHHDETFENMSENYPQAIFDQFANAETDPVKVQGVTQVDPDGSGPLPATRLTLTDMDQTINPLVASTLSDAKRELLVILLNVVSGRLSLNLVVDSQGTTLAQEIRILAGMINDAKAANDRLARNHAERINAGLAVNTRPGMSLTGDDLAISDAGSPGSASLTATRAAGAGVQFAIALPASGHVSLDVYDIAGRHVARLYEGDAPAGTTGVTWSRGSARPGVYFARLLAADGAHTAKAVMGN